MKITRLKPSDNDYILQHHQHIMILVVENIFLFSCLYGFESVRCYKWPCIIWCFHDRRSLLNAGINMKWICVTIPLSYLNEWESNRFIMNTSETLNRGATDMKLLLNVYTYIYFSCLFDILNRNIIINWCTIKDQLVQPLEPALFCTWSEEKNGLFHKQCVRY